MSTNKGRLIFILSALLVIASILGYYFVSTNESLYNKPIAKITSIKEETGGDQDSGNLNPTKKQIITAVIKNGVHKGEYIELQNTASFSQAVDQEYKVNDEVFISITENADKKITSLAIHDLKRDKYIAYAGILFIMLILLVGGIKGFKSLASVILNVIIFSMVIELYIRGLNLIFVSVVASILFIVVSMSVVSGINKKTGSAIIGTLVATGLSMLITVIVISATHSSGIHFEEMEFLTRPPEQIFIVEILIGTLGGIMDIAISISSAIKEIYDKNPEIERKVLIKSGMEIGKDIMGTMANTLVFAYMSGSIPMILLWLKNGYPVVDIISINICLEIIRALTGSIGIVISIPVTLYISVLLLKNKRIKEGMTI